MGSDVEHLPETLFLSRKKQGKQSQMVGSKKKSKDYMYLTEISRGNLLR